MPLARYFLFVGAGLFALLLVSSAYLATSQVTESAEDISPVIRIHSDRKWPERIVFDTSAPLAIPPQVSSKAGVAASALVADTPATARDAMAQLLPPNAIRPPPAQKMRDARPQRNRKIAHRRAMPPTFQVARQWRFFEGFGNGF